MALRLSAGQVTVTGNFRENNEDAVAVVDLPGATLYLVADGMGGQQAGEIASHQAITILPRVIRERLSEARGPEEIKTLLRRAVVRANDEILVMASLDRDLRSMGTTVVAALWRHGDTAAYVTGLGDSRAYLVRGGRIEQLTVDHSYVQALVEAKTISPADAKNHRYRNYLWKYLGSKEVGDGPEVKAVLLHPEDRLLLCSDGLSGVLTDDQMRDFVRLREDLQTCAKDLVQLALDSGSKDNVSCVLLRAHEGARAVR